MVEKILLNEYWGNSPEEGLAKLQYIYKNEEKLSHWDLRLISGWATYFGNHEYSMEIINNHGIALQIWFPAMWELRQLPWFKEFVRKIGLVDYWKEYGWPDTGICHPVGEDDFECD